MYQVLAGLEFVYVYSDDAVMFSKSSIEHSGNLLFVFGKIAAHNLKLKISRCTIAQLNVALFGHDEDRNGALVNQTKAGSISTLV